MIERVQKAETAMVKMQRDMEYFKMELLNREESYNKVFNRKPTVGVMAVGGGKTQAALTERTRDMVAKPVRAAAAAAKAVGMLNAAAGATSKRTAAALAGSASSASTRASVAAGEGVGLPQASSRGSSGGSAKPASLGSRRQMVGPVAAAGRAAGPRLELPPASGATGKVRNTSRRL